MNTTSREAHNAGRRAGQDAARRQLALQDLLPETAPRFAMVDTMPADRDLWPAWLHGYGQGISEASGVSLPVT